MRAAARQAAATPAVPVPATPAPNSTVPAMSSATVLLSTSERSSPNPEMPGATVSVLSTSPPAPVLPTPLPEEAVGRDS